MKRLRVLTICIALLLAACTPLNPRLPKLTELPVDQWTKIEPGCDTGCVNGAPYAFWVRRGQMGSNLLIYFQGGGMCWKAENCLREEGYDHFCQLRGLSGEHGGHL